MSSLKHKIKQPYLIALIILVGGFALLLSINDYFGINQIGQTTATEIYFVDNISRAHQLLIDRFNTEYKDRIKVIPVDLPFTKFSTNERKELLTRSLRSKSDRIDVFSVDLIWVPRFARWSEPLTMYFSEEELSGMIEHSLQSCYFDEQLVAAPFYFDVGVMYYRDDLLNSFPNHDQIERKLKQSITWEELIELKEQHPQVSDYFYMYPAKNFEGLVCSFMEGLLSQNRNIFKGDSIKLNTPEAQKALTLLVDLIHKYKMAPVDVIRFDEVQNYRYAIENDALLFRGWPGFPRNFEVDPKYEHKLKTVKVAALPHFKNHDPGSVFGGWNFMVSKFSTKKFAAVKFIKFAEERTNQELLYNAGGYLPTNKQVYSDSLFLKANPELVYYRELLKRGIHRPYIIEYTKISDVISYYAHMAIKKEISVSEALEQATQHINSDKVLIR